MTADPTAGMRRTGRVTEAIDRAVVSVVLPNEQVFGEVRGERHVRIWFAPGHYQRVTTAKLQEELATLARLLFAAARRTNREVFEEVTGRRLERTAPLARRDVDYARRLAELAVEATSDDGAVRVNAVGQQSYAVHIAAGTLDRLSQEQFQTACAQAADRLLADTEHLAARIRWEIYQPLPGLQL